MLGFEFSVHTGLQTIRQGRSGCVSACKVRSRYAVCDRRVRRPRNFTPWRELAQRQLRERSFHTADKRQLFCGISPYAEHAATVASVLFSRHELSDNPKEVRLHTHLTVSPYPHESDKPRHMQRD